MPKKILVIDDEELITRTLANALEKQGYEVLVAKNGADAVVMAKGENFDLIISDIRMPGPDAVETMKKILQICRNKGSAVIPHIFMTGYADDAMEKKAHEINPNAYFHKPFDYSEFLAEVREALTMKALRAGIAFHD